MTTTEDTIRQLQEIVRLHKEGKSSREIEALTGVDHMTVWRKVRGIPREKNATVAAPK